jgi:hypothetical protein
MQRVFAYEMGAHTSQVALVGKAEALEQQRTDGQAEYCITEELEALIVIGTEAAVCDCAAQQIRLGKPMPQALLQCSKSRVHWPLKRIGRCPTSFVLRI